MIQQPIPNKKKLSLRHAILIINEYMAANNGLARLCQRQDHAQKYAAQVAWNHLKHINETKIFLPFQKQTIQVLEKILRIIAGKEEIPPEISNSQQEKPNDNRTTQTG